MKNYPVWLNYWTFFLILLSVHGVYGQEAESSSAEELAKKLQNPIANLISLPIQGNFDFGMGPADGHRMTLNIQPVIPIGISQDWNLIARIITPVISQNDIYGNSGSQFGLGDIVATGFFSPKEPTKGGLVWGVGPVLMLPTSTDDLLGLGEFGAGPSVVLLTQKGKLTIGGLVNHIWADHFNNTFVNPFAGYNFKGGYATTLNIEMNQNWDNDAFSGVLMLQGSKVFKIGKQMVNGALAPRFFFGNARAADFGFRALLIFLFPK